MKNPQRKPLILGEAGSLRRYLADRLGRFVLFSITSIPTLAIVFMIFFIAKESMPFFENLKYAKEFFTSTDWTPSAANPAVGAVGIFYGTAMVTVVSCAVAVPLGILVAVGLSEIISARAAGIFKPIVELLAAIPSVVYGFFAIVVFAPLLQEHGGALVCGFIVAAGLPVCAVLALCARESAKTKISKHKNAAGFTAGAIGFCLPAAVLGLAAHKSLGIEISSGTNAFNASIILAIMALPTIVSISQDALSAVGRDMREGSLALGATKTETIFKVVIPCAKSGIAVAVILGLMRVVGETMVVWMASGNSLKIPEPFYNIFEPVRTMTATIAGEMGEADQSTGSARYHVLFALSSCLLLVALAMNAAGRYVGKSKLK